MKTLRSKIEELYRVHTPSIKLPLLLFAILACMVPLMIQGRVLASSSRQNQVNRRIIDVQKSISNNEIVLYQP